jgi:hypothetical protein
MTAVTSARIAAGVAAATLTAGALALAGPASATPKPHPSPRPFVAHGVVVDHSSGALTVLAADLRTGHTLTRNTRFVVSIAAKAGSKPISGSLRHLADGDRVTVSGTVSGSGDSTAYTAKGIADHAAPFHAYFGTISAVQGTLLTVAKSSRPSDDGDESRTGSFTVDVSGATESVDGSAGTPAVGQSVAVLGAQSHDLVVATSLWAFSAAVQQIAGPVSSVTGTVVTVRGRHDTTTSVDLAGVPLVFNGVSGSTPDQLTTRADVIVLGQRNTDGSFTPTLAIAFSKDCSSRSHGDGGRDGNDTDGDDDGQGNGDGHGGGDD